MQEKSKVMKDEGAGGEMGEVEDGLAVHDDGTSQ